jgi:putative addiction module component (TIGR02574 family)
MSAVLTLLRIRNLALVEELEWQIGPGLSRSREKQAQGNQSSLARSATFAGVSARIKSLIRTGGCPAGLTGSTALRFFVMPKALDEIAKEAMDLPPRQRLALAEFLLESAEAAADPEAEAEWEFEIRDRICAIDEGRVVGVAYEDVMREAEKRLSP